MPNSEIQTFAGEVVSGVGHASERMSAGSVALRQYEEVAKAKLVPGSLNVDVGQEVDMPSYAKEIMRKDHEGIAIIYITPVSVNNLPGFIIRNKKAEEGKGRHPKSIIEVISDHHLRNTLNLKDGDKVTVKF